MGLCFPHWERIKQIYVLVAYDFTVMKKFPYVNSRMHHIELIAVCGGRAATAIVFSFISGLYDASLKVMT
ncbi:MAG: hypothetical protein DHS20C01_16110 [marine bacterium B5-7]|nr:MAG: hypothetical protein DHS20C01_16110 [marine bacterium B5-7]